MSVLFMMFVMIGQFILYMGSLDKNLKVMVFGRFLFGLGGESIGITANVVLIKWFAGKELSFANALNLSIIRSATVLNTLLSPKISHVNIFFNHKKPLVKRYGLCFRIWCIFNNIFFWLPCTFELYRLYC
jgi:MFS family permease